LTVLLKDDTGVWRNINATEEADLIAPESIQEQESTLPFISVPSILIGLAFGIIITAVILRIIRRRR
jgi:hypothetical protein